jgi:hypothetical protein
MMENHTQQVINSYLSEYTKIPVNFCPTKFYSVSFDGWKNYTITCDDPTFNEIMTLAAESAKNIILLYQNTYAFTEPQFFWKLDGSFGLKIGLMELELYYELIKNENPS